MEQKQYTQLCEILREYFKDFTNQDLIDFIKGFSYHMPVKEQRISLLIDKFLEENELKKAYLDYVSDFVIKKNSTWLISDPHARGMIDNIKRILSDIAFSRFANIDFPKYKKPHKVKFLGNGAIKRGTVCVVTPIGTGGYTICSTLIDGHFTGDADGTEDAINCPDCIKTIKQCKSIEL